MPTAELILTGAKVRTLDPDRPHATAVAVRDGVIAAVGDETDVRDWRGPGTEVVSLAGAHLVPGLVDAHSHPVWGLDMATGADLSGVRDLDGLRGALRDAARIDGWVIGFGLDHNVFGGRPVHRALVEDVLGGAPAFLRLYDGHSALVSEAALALAGVTGPRSFVQRSEVVCDSDGRPTGHLVEHAAMELVAEVMPRPSYAQRRTRLVELLSAMAATGLTGAHVMDLGDPELVGAVAEETVLPVRLRFAPWCMPGADREDLDELVALQGRRGRHWRVGGVKFFMDGTVEGGTAWLEHADCHGQGTEAFWPDPAAYTAAVRQLHAAGVRTATHAIGDAAVRHVLDTVQGLGAGVGSLTGSSTWRPPRTARCRVSPSSGSSRRCSRRTPRTRAATTATSGRGGWGPSGRLAPGVRGICGTPGPWSRSARTGRSPTTTCAACWRRRRHRWGPPLRGAALRGFRHWRAAPRTRRWPRGGRGGRAHRSRVPGRPHGLRPGPGGCPRGRGRGGSCAPHRDRRVRRVSRNG